MKKLPAKFMRYGRLLLPIAVLVVTTLAAWWMFEEPAQDMVETVEQVDPVEAPPRRQEQPLTSGAGIPVDPAAPPVAASGPGVIESRDIFAVQTWEPPAPEVVPVDTPPPPPPPPEAPPLPFRFVGKLIEPGKAPVFFLARGEKVIAVQPGQRIDAEYQVGQYRDGTLQFMYLPMKIRQSLAIGSES